MSSTGVEYSKRRYAAPFGRYEGSQVTDYPGNEVLVGRERERARMLDWLLTMGARGAYLITGYRGVGKTSFVQFCIRRYEEDVYGRYLQSRVGRAFFWDRILTVGIVLLALLLPLLAAQLLDIGLALPTTTGPVTLFRLIALFPLFLAASYPFVYGCYMLYVATNIEEKLAASREGPPSTFGAETKPGSKSLFRELRRVLRFGMAFAVVTLMAHGFDHGFVEIAVLRSPLLAGSYFLALGSWCYFVVHALSITPQDKLDHDPVAGGWGASSTRARAGSRLTFLTDPQWNSWIIAVTCLGGGVALAIGGQEGESWVERYRLIALVLIFLGLLTRLADTSSFRDFIRKRGSAVIRDRWFELQTRSIIMLAFACLFFGGLLLVDSLHPLSLAFAENRPASTLVRALCAIALVVALYGMYLRKWRTPIGDVWFDFLPRPRLLFVLKGVFCVVYSVLMLRPVALAFGPRDIFVHAPRPFPNLGVECWWLGYAGLFAVCILYLEYDWIIRRGERARADEAYDPTPAETAPPEYRSLRLHHLRAKRQLAQGTIFWSLFGTWLPVLTVRVNLGFDNLQHTEVVMAMLTGLRDEYYRMFISWRSRLGLLSRLIAVAFLLVLAFAVGEWLALHMSAISAPRIEQMLEWGLSIEDHRMEAQHQDHLLRYVLPKYAFGSKPIGYFVALYHVIAFAALLITARTFGKHFRLFYYADIYARINAILDSLSSSIKTSHRSTTLQLAQLGAKIDAPSSASERDTPRQEPRTVEQAFLNVLRDVQEQHLPLPVAGHIISLPAPQITFVFDELDKIRPRVEGSTTDALPHSLAADPARAHQVHRLFADMKNILSVAPARFIFVGGRDLHDEWLADRTARQPLLSTVFDGELYLPSLLVDAAGSEPSDMLGATRAYMNAQLERNSHLHERWQRSKKWSTHWFAGLSGPLEQFFVQEPNTQGPNALNQPRGPSLANWQLYPTDFEPPKDESQRVLAWDKMFFEHLIRYLAFRSRGTPKRLNALLEGHVRPIGRVFREPETRWSALDCQHVLFFIDTHRFSIRLVSEIFDRLQPLINERVANRDDKVIRSTFYLADFLFKFHRRAFSWSSLERIDELLHAHRAPDLRELIAEIVTSWSQVFIQPILNGMHGFRFRSELAAEVRYLSRRRESDMAAFNFTLAEAQAMKQEYEARLNRFAGKTESLSEVRAALGELYDFDEEYEEARRHYAAAIAEIDRLVVAALKEPTGDLPALLSDKAKEIALRRLDLGVSQLRLMLQVGMTYERSRNYERALVEYRAARELARTIWLAMVDEYGRSKNGRPEDVAGQHRLETLKHLHILYQPLFASAWVAEKAPSAIDTSVAMLEDGLWDLRERLPFVRLAGVRPSTSPAKVTHGNFSLVIADLHHNAGNVLFFKGCQGRTSADGNGYLLQALYHYAVGLHEVRRFSVHRGQSARRKLLPLHLDAGAIATSFSPDASPEFFLRRTTAALLGLAETWLAMLSLQSLMSSVGMDATTKDEADDFVQRHTRLLKRWMEIDPRWDMPMPGNVAPEDQSLTAAEQSDLHLWLGRWRSVSPRSVAPDPSIPIGLTKQPHGWRVVDFPSTASQPAHAIKAFVALSRAAAELMIEGGHFEESAGELVRIASSLEAVLESFAVLRPPRAAEPGESGEVVSTRLVRSILVHANAALQRAADQLALCSRGDEELTRPTHAERIACSLGLIALRYGAVEEAVAFCVTAQRWASPLAPILENDKRATRALREYFRTRLVSILERNAYPVLNHLMTLRVLIVDTATFQDALPAPNEVPLADELRQLNQEYSSALHFTPFLYGSALALWARYRPSAKLKAEAIRALTLSQQTYGNRAAYYEAIAELYYLDDDFNDRCVHARHAQQMMGRDLTQSLLNELRPLALVTAPMGAGVGAPRPGAAPGAPAE